MTYTYKNKVGNVRTQNRYMLAKTAGMFEWVGLPESIPSRELEKLLQQNGLAFITKVDGVLYALSGTLGGDRDAYGNAKQIIISNPWLNFNKTLDIEKDGVLIRNDSESIGLLPLFERANTMLVENDINFTLWGYNTRMQRLFSASDDRTKQSAEVYVKRIIDGDVSVVAENAMFDGVKMQTPSSGSGVTVQQMIEYNQYIKASMYNEIGIAANFNMKRERLISSELDAAEDSLFPYVYNMMQERIDAVKRINELFDLTVDVDFGSIWALKNKELVDGLPNDEGEENGQEREESSDGSSKAGDPVVVDGLAEEEINPDIDQERERERERGRGQGPDTDSNPDKDELQAIIDDPEASEEDKQAARELLEEKE